MPLQIPWIRRLRPGHEEAVRRGWELLAAGDAEGAVEAFAAGGPHPEAPLGRARALLELGDGVGAERAARKLAVAKLPAERQQEGRRILAAALLASGKREQALRAADLALAAEPRDAAARSERARILFRLGELAEAEAEARRVTAEAPDDPEAWSLLGRVQVFQGEAGDEAFRRAAALDPASHPQPYRVSRAQFQRLASEALDEIPEVFQRYLANTLVIVEDHPSLDAVRRGTDPDLLGVYEGATALASDMPEHIVLYQKNHEHLCPTAEALRAEVRQTILHEVGHHFGMEEQELPY